MHGSGVEIASGQADGAVRARIRAHVSAARSPTREDIVLGVAPGRAFRGLGSADGCLALPAVDLGSIWRPTEMLRRRAQVCWRDRLWRTSVLQAARNEPTTSTCKCGNLLAIEGGFWREAVGQQRDADTRATSFKAALTGLQGRVLLDRKAAAHTCEGCRRQWLLSFQESGDA